MVNPDVTNCDKSTHYVAIVLSGVNKFGVPADRSMIEKAIKDSVCGKCRAV